MTAPLYDIGPDHHPTTTNQPGHKGLFYDRFYNLSKEQNKLIWVNKATGACGNAQALTQAATHQVQLARCLQGKNKCFRLDWHFVTGLGNAHPVENGFSWHPTLGTPYLPGAAVKGLIRAWLEAWCELEPSKLTQWFGSQNKHEAEQAGEFIFFDALPVEPPTLAADIMTPHMGQWYAQGDQIRDVNKEPEKVPADWHSPNPISFLVVKKAVFQFTIAPRVKDNTEALDPLMQALENALNYIGAGAKTAVGYGYMAPSNNSTEYEKGLIDDPSELVKIQIDQWAGENKLEEEVGIRYNKNKKNIPYWDLLLETIPTHSPDVVTEWENSGKNTLKGKAYKKIKKYINEDTSTP